jgi:hypothetical protein
LTIRNDRELVLAAVLADGNALKWASPKLKSDKEVVLAAVTSSPRALIFATDDLRDNFDVALVAVAADPKRALYSCGSTLGCHKSPQGIVCRCISLFHEHAAFTRGFLFGFVGGSGHWLSSLDGFNDDLKCLVAAYVGIPTGLRLKMVRSIFNYFRAPDLIEA